MTKFPILIIIPHGGYKIPQEFTDYAELNKFDLFFSADTCANEIFSFENEVHTVLDTHISKLFIDLNRKAKTVIENDEEDAIIKRITPFQKQVFTDKIFPDEVAIKNLIKRYYTPFHDSLKMLLTSNRIKLIIECHTTSAIGPKKSYDADKPRPIIRLHNKIEENNQIIQTCSHEIIKTLNDQLQRNFNNEKVSIAKDPFEINKNPSNSFILNKYSGNIPMLRLDLSRALYINDDHFNYDYLKVDQIRLNNIKKRIWSAIEKTYLKFYTY